MLVKYCVSLPSAKQRKLVCFENTSEAFISFWHVDEAIST